MTVTSFEAVSCKYNVSIPFDASLLESLQENTHTGLCLCKGLNKLDQLLSPLQRD